MKNHETNKIPEIWAPISRKFRYDVHSAPMKTATNLPATKEKDGAIKPRLFIKKTLLNRCDALGAQGNGLRYLTLS